MENLTCPKCGNDTFTEWAKQLTFQKGVKVFPDGDRDYFDAGCNEFSDDFEVVGYQCDECKIDLILKGKELIEE